LNGNPSSISFIYHVDNGNSEAADDYAPDNYTERGYSYLIVGVEDIQVQTVPEEFEFKCNVYPNPFNSSVVFEADFNTVLEDDLQINIYNIMGELVYKDVIAKAGSPGLKYLWNASSGRYSISSGIYLYQIKGERTNLSANGKLIYLK
jgi:hypothetical protein